MRYFAIAILGFCVSYLVGLLAGKFAAFCDGPHPMSPEELDRAALNAFYREIVILLLGIGLGASLFCLFVGVAIAKQITT